MRNLRPEIKNLIKLFNEDQVNKVNKLLKIENDQYLIDYSILAIAIEDDLVYGDSKMIKEFFQIDDLSLLNKVDILIAKIITTLAQKTNVDIKTEYYNNFNLDPSKPELIYLVNVMEKHLMCK